MEEDDDVDKTLALRSLSLKLTGERDALDNKMMEERENLA